MSLFDPHPKLHVKMTGKEYLEYKKYRDTKQWKITSFHGVIMMVILFCTILGVIVLDDLLTPPPSATLTEFMHIGEVAIPLPIVYIVIIGLAGGWVLHGVGFYIIRR